jgi:hypothetical protein
MSVSCKNDKIKEEKELAEKNLEKNASVLDTFVLFFFFLFLLNEVSLCILDWPQTHNSPASATSVLGLQVCTNTPSQTLFYLLFHKQYSITTAYTAFTLHLLL